LGYIIDASCEVGLHGGYYSYNDPKTLKEEKNRLEKALGKSVIGIRMHYLRFDVPSTWRMLANLGFKYDTTFGYPDMPGFRNGMCHPFKPYDLEKNQEINILEIPLTIMDGSLFKMNFEEAWSLIKILVENVEKNAGLITILWHNTTFDEVFWGKWSKLYAKILQLLKERKAWMATAEDIYKYWVQNI
jgi:peptidoglycan/xylan/chitin deacetylase (PgdA/CDA1 family)